ncbi:FAD-binding oxidoreductase [Buchnera aphidicola (Formosaphis micheliae)]|uniref:FAD-binding oxidoreductase n=1 Tax=Buchnera aphidicola TaxID=9 RepID=UPI0031CC9FFF
MNEWVVGRIIKINQWSKKLFSIILHASIDPFIAGQFAKLSFQDIHKTTTRAYSYVNSPNNKNLEFYFVLVPHGKITDRLSNLKVNDEILITKKSSGFFTLKEIPICENLWMLATGTGIGPYLSILQDYNNKIKKFKNIILVHAVKYHHELTYYNLMKKLKNQYNGKLHVHIILSQEKYGNYLLGRIPNLIKDNTLETVVGLPMDPISSHVMLCGNPNMVRDTKVVLIEIKNMKKHFKRRAGHITSENYW